MRPLRPAPTAVLLAALSLLAGAAPARAAAPWSAPQTLSPPHLFVDAPSLLTGGDGRTLATWTASDGLRTLARTGVAAATRAPGAAAFGPERTVLPAAGALAPTPAGPPVPYATGRAILATQQPVDARSGRVRLAAAFGTTTGRFGTPHVLTTAAGLRGPRLAADARGDAAVAWWEDRGVRTDRVLVALRRAGGSFPRTPLRLATDRVRSVSVAVSPRGAVLVAWDALGVIRVRVRAAGARSFGATQTLDALPAYAATLRTAVTDRGRAYVAWTAQNLTEGGDRGPFTAQVAVRPVGAVRFRSAQLLELEAPVTGATQAGVDLAVDGEDATVAWAGRFAGHERIRVATTDRAARFRGVTDVSAEGVDGTAPSLAAAAGRRVLAWVRGDGDTGGAIDAAVAPPGGPFDAPEIVEPGPEARLPDVTLPADGGAPTVVWSQRPDGSGGPLASIRTFARAATRTG